MHLTDTKCECLLRTGREGRLTKAQHSVIPDSGTSSKLASVFQASSDSLKGKEFQVCMNFPCTVNALTSLKSCRYIITNFTSVLYLLIACNFLQTFQPRCLPCFLHPPLATTPSWFFPTVGGVRGKGQGEKGHTYLLASIATQWCKLDRVSIQFHFHKWNQ